MANPCLSIGYRGAIQATITYDGGGALAVDLDVDTYASVYDVASTLAAGCQALAGGAWSATINAAWIITLTVGAGHNFTLAWGSVTLRNYLGFAADLAPAAQSFTAPAAPPGVWLPGREIIGVDGRYDGREQWSRADDIADSTITRSIHQMDTIAFDFFTDLDDVTNVANYLNWANLAMEAPQFALHPDYTQPLVYTRYIVPPSKDEIRVTMDQSTGYCRKWISSMEVREI